MIWFKVDLKTSKLTEKFMFTTHLYFAHLLSQCRPILFAHVRGRREDKNSEYFFLTALLLVPSEGMAHCFLFERKFSQFV